jgi:hypothetical protein
MKNNILLLITLVLGIWSCSKTPTASITIAVMADKTDPLIPKPNILHIKSFLKDVKYDEGMRVFRFQTITDSNVNESFGAKLPAKDPFGNSLQYKANIRKFYQRIDTLFATNNKEQHTFKSSSILKPLLAQLDKLQASNTTKKVLLLYSDILEASDVFNVYNERNQQPLLTKPKEVVQHLKSQGKIPQLEGVELYIIYYPTNRMNNRLFEKMTLVYKELFKDSGLKIHIGIDNTIQL